MNAFSLILFGLYTSEKLDTTTDGSAEETTAIGNSQCHISLKM